MFIYLHTTIAISMVLILSLQQVQSKLRSAAPLDGEDVNMMERELLEMKAYRPQTGFGGMCNTNSDCAFTLYPGAFMQCCTSGTDLNTCHFFCNSMLHSTPKSAAPEAVSGANRNSVNTASAPLSHTRHGVHDIGTLLASGQTGENNNVNGVIINTVGQNNAANGITLNEIGQNNAVNGVTIATVGQNNAANGITLKEIGQNNKVNGNTLEDATYGGGATFSMNYYYNSARLSAVPDVIEDAPIDTGLLPVRETPKEGDYQIIALSTL